MFKWSIITFFLLPLFILTSPAVAEEYFRTEWDSTSGAGYVDSLVIFNGRIDILVDHETNVTWRRTQTLPEHWYSEVCQLSFLCWSQWVDGASMFFNANQVDTLQIKFHPELADGSGDITILLFSDEDTTFREELHFHLDAHHVSVRQSSGDGREGLAWRDVSPTRIGFVLPNAASVTAGLFDMQGRKLGTVWQGYGLAGHQSINIPQMYGLSSGVYLLRLNAHGIGSISRQITIVR